MKPLLSDEMNEITDRVLTMVERRLKQKEKIYGAYDRLHNFRAGARFLQEPARRVCWAFMTKHLVRLTDFINGVAPPTAEDLDEVIGDIIAYMVLLYAIMLQPGEYDT